MYGDTQTHPTSVYLWFLDRSVIILKLTSCQRAKDLPLHQKILNARKLLTEDKLQELKFIWTISIFFRTLSIPLVILTGKQINFTKLQFIAIGRMTV